MLVFNANVIRVRAYILDRNYIARRFASTYHRSRFVNFGRLFCWISQTNRFMLDTYVRTHTQTIYNYNCFDNNVFGTDCLVGWLIHSVCVFVLIVWKSVFWMLWPGLLFAFHSFLPFWKGRRTKIRKSLKKTT